MKFFKKDWFTEHLSPVLVALTLMIIAGAYHSITIVDNYETSYKVSMINASGSAIAVYSNNNKTILLTNKHVCNAFQPIAFIGMTLPNKLEVENFRTAEVYEAQILNKSTLYDLCLLLINKGDLPVTENISERLILIPCFFELKQEEQDRVFEAIKTFFL